MVVGQKPFGLCTVLERVEQHGLADAAQPADDHALLCRAALETADQNAELLELLITPCERSGRDPAFGVYGLLIGSIVYMDIASYT